MSDSKAQAAPDLEFEREKWRIETEFRRRELELAERAQKNDDDEVIIKRQDAWASRLANPLFVGVILAFIAGFGNAWVAQSNGKQQRDLESARSQSELVAQSKRAEAERALEQARAESSLVLEVIKTGDPQKAATNLRFLVETGLVSDPALKQRLDQYLKNHPEGAAVLPASKDFTFEKTAGATAEATKQVTNVLTPFVQHLKAIGFPSNLPKVSIRIDPSARNPSSYYPNEKILELSPAGEKEEMFALAEYAVHVLQIGRPVPDILHGRAIQLEYGLRDYLVASYLNDPNLDRRAMGVYQAELPYLQLLNERSYTSIKPGTDQYEAGAVWASAFWAMRTQIGPEKLDPLLVRAWRAVPASTDDPSYAPTYLGALRRLVASSLTGAERKSVEQVLTTRGFP